MKPAIRVHNLGKRYRVSHAASRGRYRTLRESLADAATAPLRRFRNGGANGSVEDFWALKDVNFEVQPGEVVGIIGRNGAGKSTLLKILSRITEPTTGQIRLNGRIASLLEVGTGFHPELSGRENIFLNGSILGMTRREIDSKFDDIVSFADISRFLDTPVKRYSSGMYVRLAFAVAAHLDPEILLVDEVLAVGDAQFQKRCLGRLGELAHSGRTVFLVSHNMAAISNLCTTAAHFENGQCQRIGDVNDIVSTYLSSSRSSLGTRADFNRLRPQWAQPLITQASILDVQGRAREVFPLGSDVVVEMSFDSSECTVGTLKDPVMGIVINHHSLGVVAGINTLMAGFHSNRGPRSAGTLRATLKRLPFLQGSYTIDLWLGDGQTNLDNVMGALSFEIEASDIYGSGTPPMGHLGAAFLEADWCFEART